MSETINAEFEVVELPTRDNLGQIQWRMKTGELIRVKEMEDSHIRNCALFLMGMGYQRCGASEEIRVAWLRVFRMEWERRENAKAHGHKKYIVYGKDRHKMLGEDDGD